MPWEMIQIFHIQIVCEFRFFNKKLSVLNSPNINKNLLFEVIFVFYLFLFSHMYLVCCGLSLWKKGFTAVSLLPLTKKLGRSSYDVTMTHYDIMLILFFFTFVANVRDLQWDNFLLLNRRGVIRIYLPRAKMTPPPPPTPPQAYMSLK